MTNLDPEGLAARGGVGAKKVRQKKGHFSSKGPNPIALGTFSNLEHYFTFPALLSTFWAEFEHFFAFWATLKHLFFLQFSTMFNAIFCLRNVFSKPLKSRWLYAAVGVL